MIHHHNEGIIPKIVCSVKDLTVWKFHGTWFAIAFYLSCNETSLIFLVNVELYIFTIDMSHMWYMHPAYFISAMFSL